MFGTLTLCLIIKLKCEGLVCMCQIGWTNHPCLPGIEEFPET